MPLYEGSLIQIAQVETIDEAGSMMDLAETQWTLESPEDYDHGGTRPSSCPSAREVTHVLSTRDYYSARDCSHCRL
jgi:hypothetical protein